MSDIQAYLDEIKTQGRSAPAGIHWDKLCKLVRRCSKVDDDEELYNPLILGGHVASHSEKHQRLAHHLKWAERHHCLEEALAYLKVLPDEHWNRSMGDDWTEDYSWVLGE